MNRTPNFFFNIKNQTCNRNEYYVKNLVLFLGIGHFQLEGYCFTFAEI